MNLLQLITTVNIPNTVAAHNAAYAQGDKYIMTADWYRDVLIPSVKGKILINSPGCTIELNHIKTTYDDPIDNTESLDVSIRDPEGKRWSLSFMPWGELLTYEVDDRTHLNLTNEQVAAHMIWELTWHGMEGDSEETKDTILDRSDQLSRDLDEHDKAISEGKAEVGSLPKGYKVFDIDSLFEGETVEEKAERQAEFARRRANGATAQRYENGQLQHKD